MSKKTLICIVGPTAAGKTNVAVQLAKSLSCEVISCDSRQFFKEMSIGTAKPTKEEMDGVNHHFVNSHSIHDYYSVGDFERDCLSTLDTLFKDSPAAIMAGGSGLYVKAVCEGLDHFPPIDISFREQLNIQFEEEGIIPLQKKLKELDPTCYSKIDPQNSQRVIRALEVCLGTGQPYSSFLKNEQSNRPFNILKIGINMEREVLFSRINQRVDQMVELGLVEEAKTLYPFKEINSLQTVGYQELFDHFEGKTSVEEAVELIKRNSRRYAKRQLTWFRKDQSTSWYSPDDFESILNKVKSEI